jgi:hypothetical protein
MSTAMLDVLSVLDKNDEPVLANCTLQMGEVALEFKNGRSKVPAQQAAEVLRHPQVMIPGYTGAAAPLPPNEAAELPAIGDVRQQHQETPAEREARLREAESYLTSQGLAVPQRAISPAEEAAALRARLAELEQSGAAFGDGATPTGTVKVVVPDGVVPGETPGWPVDAVSGEPLSLTPAERETLAKAALGSETIPDGFEAETSDGQPRCWARKGDGKQCSNAAVDGTHACGLRAHQK